MKTRIMKMNMAPTMAPTVPAIMGVFDDPRAFSSVVAVLLGRSEEPWDSAEVPVAPNEMVGVDAELLEILEFDVS